jgi:hypothetical protein
VTLQNGLRVKERITHMQRASFCGTMEVVKEVDGSSVRVAHAQVGHGHAAGNIALAVPFRGINNVPTLRLELADHCYKVTGRLMDDGTVWH